MTNKIVENLTLSAAADLTKAIIAQNPSMTSVEAVDNVLSLYKQLATATTGALPQSATSVQAAVVEVEAEAVEPQRPAVPIEDSVQNDYIVCLEDGTQHKMMKRYLKRVYGMTPEQYRQKWDLPNDYPVVAPGYSAQKAAEAHAVGLGHHANKRGAARLDEQNEQVLAA